MAVAARVSVVVARASAVADWAVVVMALVAAVMAVAARASAVAATASAVADWAAVELEAAGSMWSETRVEALVGGEEDLRAMARSVRWAVAAEALGETATERAAGCRC